MNLCDFGLSSYLDLSFHDDGNGKQGMVVEAACMIELGFLKGGDKVKKKKQREKTLFIYPLFYDTYIMYIYTPC